MNWDVDIVGQFASYDTAVASLPGMAPRKARIAWRRRCAPILMITRPAVQDPIAKRFQAKFGRCAELSIGEVGVSPLRRSFCWKRCDRAGRDLTDGQSVIKAMESIHELQGHLTAACCSFGPDQHHASTKVRSSTVVKRRPLGAGGRSRAELLISASTGSRHPRGWRDHAAPNGAPHLSRYTTSGSGARRTGPNFPIGKPIGRIA